MSPARFYQIDKTISTVYTGLGYLLIAHAENS